MKKLLVPMLLVFATASAAFAHQYRAGPIEIAHPWSRPTPAGAPAGAGYMVLTNDGRADVRLVGGSTSAAAKVEIHEMSMEGGIMRMRPVKGGLVIPAGGSVALEPGGYHIMFIGLRQSFAVGQRIPVTLTFQGAPSVQVEFTVEARAPGDHGDH